MEFGLFYQHQLPRPWVEGVEVRNFADHLAQCVLAESLGFRSIWVTEHHFLEEYSHSSAPEVFLGAVAARTSRIRLGHGIRHVPPAINPPARLAEGVATLDVISDGRVDFGFGEGATKLELGAHYIPGKDKREMALEAAEQIANMLAMSPYPGFQGKYFSMECRNIVPKPVQKPHPPLWMACTNRETIKVAARLGVGALAFSYVEPEEAAKWVQEYYAIIASDECVPLGHAVNARVAMVSGLALAEDRAQAVRDGYHCSNFFRFALQSTILEDSVPGYTDLWGAYMEQEGGDRGLDRAVTDAVAAGDGYSGSSGTPADVIRRMKVFQEAGVDDILFTIQGGNRTHENICRTLDMFSQTVMPAFANSGRREIREAELRPHIANAMLRKQFMPALSRDEVPVVPGARRNVTPDFEKLKIG